MRVAAIVQARMGSTRLPGKVLAPVGDRSVLAHVVARLARCRRLDEVVIATTELPGDDELAAAAAALGVTVVRGSADDVLSRYLSAARTTGADAIVRVTADCPLIDPGVVDEVVAALTDGGVDYASNTHRRSYPRGLDCEALWRDTLERIGRLGTSAAAREHVTAFVLEQPALFRTRQVVAEPADSAGSDDSDDADLRLTVDTPDDLALVRALDRALDLAAAPPWRAVVTHLRAHPELVRMNAHVEQKPWSSSHA